MPRASARRARLPRISGRCRGASPKPGRMTRTFCGGERLARGDIAHDINRAAEHHVALLDLGARGRAGAERLERSSGAVHQRGEFVGLQRERRVRSAVGAPQGEVLLDQAGAERHRRNRHLDAERVVGETDRTAELGGERRECGAGSIVRPASDSR